jgi:hypothetical protein
MKRADGKEKKKIPAGLQQHLDYSAYIREKLKKKGITKSVPELAKYAKKFLEEAKKSLGENADKKSLYDKAKKLVDNELK